MSEPNVIIIVFLDDTQYKGNKIYIGWVGSERDGHPTKSIHKIYEVDTKFYDGAGQLYFRYELTDPDLPINGQYMIYAVSSTPEGNGTPDGKLYLGSCAYLYNNIGLPLNQNPLHIFLTLHQI